MPGVVVCTKNGCAAQDRDEREQVGVGEAEQEVDRQRPEDEADGDRRRQDDPPQDDDRCHDRQEEADQSGGRRRHRVAQVDGHRGRDDRGDDDARRCPEHPSVGAGGMEDEQQRAPAEGDARELADRARRGGEDDDREQDEDQDDPVVVLPRERARELSSTRFPGLAGRQHPGMVADRSRPPGCGQSMPTPTGPPERWLGHPPPIPSSAARRASARGGSGVGEHEQVEPGRHDLADLQASLRGEALLVLAGEANATDRADAPPGEADRTPDEALRPGRALDPSVRTDQRRRDGRRDRDGGRDRDGRRLRLGLVVDDGPPRFGNRLWIVHQPDDPVEDHRRVVTPVPAQDVDDSPARRPEDGRMTEDPLREWLRCDAFRVIDEHRDPVGVVALATDREVAPEVGVADRSTARPRSRSAAPGRDQAVHPPPSRPRAPAAERAEDDARRRRRRPTSRRRTAGTFAGCWRRRCRRW